jgi:hypothetical protein
VLRPMDFVTAASPRCYQAPEPLKPSSHLIVSACSTPSQYWCQKWGSQVPPEAPQDKARLAKLEAEMTSIKSGVEACNSAIAKISEKLLQDKQRPSRASFSTCYRCGKEDHYSRECPNANGGANRSRSPSPMPQRCFTCNRPGHRSKDCRSRSPSPIPAKSEN